MAIALVPYVGAGSEDAPFRPEVVGEWAAIDLRADPARAGGFALVSALALPASAVVAGATLDSPMQATVRSRLGSALGVTVSAPTVRELLPELLLTHATEDGRRWRPLRAHRRTDGKLVRQAWLGGLAWEQVIEGGPGAMLSESFNKADSTTLGPDQAWTETHGDWAVVTNAAEGMGTGLNVAVANATLATGDHRATTTILANTGSPCPFVRSTTDGLNYYYGRMNHDGTWQLFKFVNGTSTLIGSLVESVPATPFTIEVRAQGSAITLLLGSTVKVGPITDTSIGANLRVGIRTFGTKGRIDSFVGADIAPFVTQGDAAGLVLAAKDGTSALGALATQGNAARLVLGARDGSNVWGRFLPQPDIAVAFDSDPLSAAPMFSDISEHGSELVIRQGRQQELDAFQPGTINGPLDNSDRRFDPRHAGSPYAGKLKPRKRVQVRTTQGGSVHNLANGYVHGWPQGYQHPEMASTELSATDAFMLLASAELPGSVYEVEVRKDNPHAWWRLGETVGITALDSSGNGYDGVYVGGATFNTRQGLIFGDDDNGIEFDPARKQSVGILSADVTTYPLTVEFWMQVTPEQKPPDSARIWSQGDGRLARISLRSDGTLGALFGGVTAFTPAAYSDGQAHHVVVRATSAEVRIFVDGISRVASTGAPGPMNDGPVFLAQSGTFPYFAGILDEVAMYRSALADSRISAHYVAGTKPWDGDTTGARVNKVLDLIGWPAAERDVDAGNSTLGPAQLRRAKALNYLQLIERTEQGALYMKPDNALRFRERRKRFYDTRMTTPQWTLTDEDTAGALHYEGDLKPIYDEDLIYNEVTVRWDGGEVTVIDEPSRGQYGPKGHNVDTIARTADDARWIAEWVLDHYKQPQDRIASVTVNPGVDPLLWDVALASRVGDRVALRRHPQGIGDPFRIEAHVEGKEHVIGTDTWTTTLPLSVAETKRYWILGTSALGVDTYLGY